MVFYVENLLVVYLLWLLTDCNNEILCSYGLLTLSFYDLFAFLFSCDSSFLHSSSFLLLYWLKECVLGHVSCKSHSSDMFPVCWFLTELAKC